ncbi:MAG: response regulator/pilus assembly protein [Veillonellaceae bacterium]|nr:response regulator/pilus assembly protein [Veillonellaceae bacterium]
MSDKIKMLILDEVATTRDSLKKLIEYQAELEAVCLAGTGEEAIIQAKKLGPDIILMDANVRGGNGIDVIERLSVEAPEAAIIIMSTQGKQEYLQRALLAGAKNYLIKPFDNTELVNMVRQVYKQQQRLRNVLRQGAPSSRQPGKVISIISNKGGAGKTTIAVNLAVALAERPNARVGILDANLQFGDVATYLNLAPRASIADAAVERDTLDEVTLETYMTSFNDRLSLLAAPARPEQAEAVTGGSLKAILSQMKKKYEYVVVDTATDLNEITLSVLDESDAIVVLAGSDLPTLKNMKLCLEILQSLKYGEDKVHIVLNRANSAGGLSVQQVEKSLNLKFYATIPSDGKTVLPSINHGIPFVLSNNHSAVAQTVFQLAQKLAPPEIGALPKRATTKFLGIFG